MIWESWAPTAIILSLGANLISEMALVLSFLEIVKVPTVWFSPISLELKIILPFLITDLGLVMLAVSLLLKVV